MIPVRTPYIVRKYFNDMVWNLPTEEKILYLTFDDGPIPEVTPWIMETLSQYNAGGTFFLIGENVRRHPEIFAHLKDRNFVYGNHTYNHISGWKARDEEYYRNIQKAQELINSAYFRPPYGRITRSQLSTLKNHYKIIMWDVLSKDYDMRLSGIQCAEKVIQFAKPGSIVVFHDSIKARERIQYALPKVLEHFSMDGYSFKSINIVSK